MLAKKLLSKYEINYCEWVQQISFLFGRFKMIWYKVLLPIPPDYVGKELVIASLVANVEAMIRADRKVTALKQLQVS